MANGFIYILSNPSFMDGMIKIGKSQKDPVFRKEELNSSGVPEPFEVEYFAFVEDYDDVELNVHSKLDNRRPNKNREFFSCSIPEAILVIRQSSRVKYEEVFNQTLEEIEKVRKEKEAEINEQKKQEALLKERERIRLENEFAVLAEHLLDVVLGPQLLRQLDDPI